MSLDTGRLLVSPYSVSMDGEELKRTVSDVEPFDDSLAEQFSVITQDSTALAIKQCEKYYLTPYSRALKFIGWLPANIKYGRVFQVALVVFWTVAILTSFTVQILSCFRRDVFVPGEVGMDGNVTLTVISCKEHIISSLIITDMILLVSYFFGVYLFSKGETEYLFRLAGQVFIKNLEAGSGVHTNKFLIGTMVTFLVAGLVWIISSTIIRILTAIALEFFLDHVVVQWSTTFTIRGGAKVFLLIISLLGFLTFDLVYVGTVMNYMAQSELNIYFLWDIRKLLETKKYERIDDSIKDVFESRRYLQVLNGKTATATALVLFLLGGLAFTALIDLDRVNEGGILTTPHMDLATATAVLNIIFWGLLFCLPFIQAARVTYAGELLKDMSVEIRARPFQYHNTPQLELDSLLSFLHAIQLRASIFGVPIFPWMVYGVLVAFTFSLLLLFQLGIYNFSEYL